MAKRGKNNYYAIVRSRDAPAIYSSWAIAQSKVNGYSNAIYEGFKTLNEAKSFMENNGCCNYEVWDDDVKGERAPKEGEVVYYAVARGRRSGVYEHYR
ncbi:hypothetical protein DSL72_004731 [Monilinia vaccinii-corymbosi]|uniref:Ribonuclease H1 N-terminal domain-containing protein n=1 Tax=Monilinia vaccinii-corymbosi TaxID=61207 RepID=A0A8A3P587_9HELO|nr:hypothetical protein DSL72_004731 [Monilinia vaccinii-corymbosi]